MNHHRRRRTYRPKWHAKRCGLCGRMAECEGSTWLFCYACRKPAENMRSRAGSIVSGLVCGGVMPAARTLKCVDCGKQAMYYDHRDYSKPLQVDPVCGSCNKLRGPALQFRKHLMPVVIV